VIDTATETVLPFSQAARRIPPIRAGRPISPTTIWRWATVGCRAKNGERVRLETIRIGGASCTSLEALQRFFARLSGDEPAQPPSRRTSRGHAQAEAALDTAGI
jgi:hypothetical protein